MPEASGARGLEAGLSRRQFVKAAGVTAAGTLLPGLLDRRADAGSDGGKPPNILFILVDEMRSPKSSWRESTRPRVSRTIMPNTFQLWRNGGVANHHTAATACTPGRALVSGLYSQQSWAALTLLSQPGMHVAPSC
jgi:hypothetical protein